MADCQGAWEEAEMPGGDVESAQVEGVIVDEGLSEGDGQSSRGGLEEGDQTTSVWEKEEDVLEKKEEEEDTSDTTGDEEEEVDPRVAENLEILNQNSAEVNRLENELDEARSKHRSTFQTSSQRMEQLGAKIKKSIQRARLYFQLLEEAKQAQNEALRAARSYQSAQGNYRAAKEMVTLAEKGLEDNASKTRTLSSAWQETLGHAMERVTEAEREKARSEIEHNKKAAICAQLESKIQFQEKKYKRSIAKARPYFETKAELELKLQQLRQNVLDLQHAIGIRKARYAEALRCLDAVSTEIHESRRSRKKRMLQYPREPGVGAETDSLGSSVSEANLERGIFSSTASFQGEEDEDEDSEEAGDVFSPDSPSRSSAGPLSKHGSHSNPETEDTSDGRVSRSISSASVFSSECQSDSASESPGSPSVVPTSPLHCPAAVTASTSPPGQAGRLMDLARGDLATRQLRQAVDTQSPGAATGEESEGSQTTSERGTAGSAEDAPKMQNLPLSPQIPDCQREAGDGSAQEDCPGEGSGSSQPTPNSQSALCSQFSSALAPSSQAGVLGEAQSPEQAVGAHSPGASARPAKSSGSPQKSPLRRTDVATHRPLQGVMLLNPSDLASSSYYFGPNR